MRGRKNQRKFLRGERVPRADQTLQSGNQWQSQTIWSCYANISAFKGGENNEFLNKQKMMIYDLHNMTQLLGWLFHWLQCDQTHSNILLCLQFVFWFVSTHCYSHRHTGQGGGSCPPPSVVRNINLSGNFCLRVGQSSCSCFVLLIFLIFSFHLSLAPCIKTHTKMQEMALKRLYFSKFSWRACPGPPRGSHAFGASQANSCLPPQNF